MNPLDLFTAFFTHTFNHNTVFSYTVDLIWGIYFLIKSYIHNNWSALKSTPATELLIWGESHLSWASFHHPLKPRWKGCDSTLIGQKEMVSKKMPDQHQKIQYLGLKRLWHGLQWLTEQHPQLFNVILTFQHGALAPAKEEPLRSSANLFSFILLPAGTDIRRMS